MSLRSPKEVITLAGNASSERRAADARLAEAKKSGVKGNTLAQLQATRDAARDNELSQTGGDRQAGER